MEQIELRGCPKSLNELRVVGYAWGVWHPRKPYPTDLIAKAWPWSHRWCQGGAWCVPFSRVSSIRCVAAVRGGSCPWCAAVAHCVSWRSALAPGQHLAAHPWHALNRQGTSWLTSWQTRCGRGWFEWVGCGDPPRLA